MPTVEQLDDPRAEAAIQWMVDMCSGEMTEHQLRSFEAWLNGDPRNEAAWIKLQEGLLPCGVASRQGLPPGALTDRLAKMSSSRRQFLTGIVGLLGAGAVGALSVDHFLPKGALTADHVTLTGQQERIWLADGSSVFLAPRAAVDIDYRPDLRSVRVIDGEVLVTAASGINPFRIDIDQVSLMTNDSVFSIRRRPGRLSITGVEGEGVFGPAPGHHIGKSERIVFANNRFERETADLEVDTAWTDGLLLVKNETLASVVEELRPYFVGVIRVNPGVANLRVTAVLPLEDPNTALDALASSLDLEISRISDYWVSIGSSKAFVL